ncbi:MAG: aldehyde dehydrogenase family protein, partial [Anaerolineae bacterium]|nr:aldehyde dehydrogenase family protein [Anaerolineae bacterium]
LAFFERLAAPTLAPRRTFTGLAPHRMHWIERRPFGVVLVIGPWNFPLLLTIAPIAAALVAGNTVVLKPSEFAPLSTEAMVACLREAGIPRGVFEVAHGDGALGAALIDARPDKIAFTGSVPTGKKIAQQAAKYLIPLTLELGSKDAAIVLEDAPLDRTARGLAWGAMYSAGQACLSIELVYVQRRVQDELIRRIGEVIMREVHVGPGESPGVTMGAIVTEAQVQTIERQVRDAIERGARLVRGGERLERDNRRYFAPTLITDVTPDMRIMQDETFGPVIAFRAFDDVADAIREINASPYGLTGSVWTRDRARGLAIASQLQVGHASVNDHVFSASIPHLPWGGTKESGYGATRGREGLLDMTRPQSFSIERFRPLPTEIVWYPYTPTKYMFLRRLLRVLYARGALNKLRALFRG